MNPAEPELETCDIVQVSWSERWQVYRRLQELEIPCWCAVDRPLRVKVNTPKQVAQLGSVLRQFSASRRELVQLLDRCWQTAYKA
ncbi:MAG: Asr1405/Asl0597 family protein [Microcoleus sp.]